MMRKYSAFHRVLQSIPALLGWLMLSLVLWGFIFLRITDTSPERKLTVYFDCELKDPTEVMARMEDLTGITDATYSGFGGNPAIRMIKVRQYGYSVMSRSDEPDVDLFIIRDSEMEACKEWLLPLPEEFCIPGGTFELNGEALGISVCDPETDEFLFGDLAEYDPSQRYYLCFSSCSAHVGKMDHAAFDLARVLINRK